MRPIKLEIAGLQSFRTKQTIDFEKLCHNNIFGIFGPTGSGKSTILDAIILALYNEIPRNVDLASQSSTLYSNLNRECDEMAVCFSFRLNDEVIEVMRSYNYKESRKIAFGPYRQYLKIFKHDQEIYQTAKTQEINQLIIEKVGLNKNEFLRVVVLPQGKFGEFLKLKGLERRQMLETIFDLEKYGQKLEETIKKDRNDLEEQLKDLTTKIALSPSQDQLDELNNEINETTTHYHKLKTNQEEVNLKLSCLTKQLELIQERDININKLNLLDQKRDYINKTKQLVAQLEKIEPISKSYHETKELELNIINLNKAIETNLLQIKKFERDLDKINDEINSSVKLEHSLQSLIDELEVKSDPNIIIDYQKLDDVIKLKEKNKNSLNDLISKQEGLNNQKIIINDKLQPLVAFKAFNEQEINQKIQIVTEQLNSLNDDLKQKNNDGEIFKKNQESLKISQKELNKQRLQLKDLLELKNQLQSSHINDLASLLAQTLKENEPCLVCGSLSHPCPASKQDQVDGDLEAITQEVYQKQANLQVLESQIKTLKQDLAKCLIDYQINEITALDKLIEQDKIKIDQFKKSIIELQTKLKQGQENKHNYELYLSKHQSIENSISEISERLNQIGLEINDNDRLIDCLKNKYNFINLNEELARAIKDYNDAKESLIKNKKQLNQNSLNISNLKDKLNKLNQLKAIESTNLANNEISLNTNVEKQLVEQAYLDQSLSKINLNLKDLDQLFNKLSQKDDLIKQVTDYDTELVSIQATIKQLESKITHQVDQVLVDQTIEVQKQINQEFEQTSNHLTLLKQSLKDKTTLFEQAKIDLQNQIIIDQKLSEIQEILSLVASKRFVSFLANKKLKQLTYEASNRIKHIFNGKYELEVDDDNNYYVIDRHQGAKRSPVATLSGGETFIFALSLALALSNSLKQGKAHIDFFFLDEGFGTLDELSLEKVIDELKKMKAQEGLVVGLISHVEKLKEQIPVFLKVEPASELSGSQVKIGYN